MGWTRDDRTGRMWWVREDSPEPARRDGEYTWAYLLDRTQAAFDAAQAPSSHYRERLTSCRFWYWSMLLWQTAKPDCSREGIVDARARFDKAAQDLADISRAARRLGISRESVTFGDVDRYRRLRASRRRSAR